MLSPTTIVDKASIVEEAGSPLIVAGYKCIFCVVQNAFKRAFGSFFQSCVYFFNSYVNFKLRTTRSVTDTLGVGTRIAIPFNLPLSSGRTRPIAFAAPVLEGMMFSAAARARRSVFSAERQERIGHLCKSELLSSYLLRFRIYLA